MAIQQISSAEIADGTVIAADIADGSVTGPKIGQNAINANNVVSGTFASPSSATTYTANQTFVVANVTNQLISSGAAYQNIIRLTDAATITPNLAQTNSFIVTLGGARTMANATNIIAGQSGVIVITQDGTGGRTLAFGSYWDFSGGTAPTLTTAASAVDVLVYYVNSTTSITASLISNIS